MSRLKISNYVAPALVFLLVAMTYCCSAHPTITWWDGASYPLASAVLGVPSPPGSIFFLLLGRLFLSVPGIADPAGALNLMIGFVSAGAAVFAFLVVRRILCRVPSNNRVVTDLSAAIAALTLATLDSVWNKATYSNPYALSLFFTAVTLFVFTRWSDHAHAAADTRYLLLLAFLFGLDFCVHRSNGFLFLAIAIAILWENWRIIVNWKLLLALLFLVVLGFSPHLMLIVRSRLHPPLDMQNPESWSAFWRYFSLQEYGIASFWEKIAPRQGPFWAYQTKEMYLRYFNWNFVGGVDGPSTFFSLQGLWAIPLLVGIIGITYHFARDWRRALFLVLVFLLTSLGVILYLNVPQGYFREIHRHFLPSFLVFSLWIGLGVFALLDAIRKSFVRSQLVQRGVVLTAALLLFIVLPLSLVRQNLARNQHSGDYFAYDYSYNMLQTCTANAILFTNGDNDTYPLWYLQLVKKVRADVKVINLSLLNTHWYVRQLKMRYPDLPLALNATEIEALQPIRWQEKTIEVPVPEAVYTSFLSDSPAAQRRADMKTEGTPERKDSLALQLKVAPTLGGAGIRVQDLIILQIIKDNAWKLPIYFAGTVSPQNLIGVQPYLRQEGLALRLTTVSQPDIDSRQLQANLIEKFQYRGIRDARVFIDEYTKTLFNNYRPAFLQLVDYYLRHHEPAKAMHLFQKMEEILPQERLPSTEELQHDMISLETRLKSQQ